jgi:small subunit ribosomal protein S6
MLRYKELEKLETGIPIHKHECIFIIDPELEKTLLDTIVNRYKKLMRSFQGHVKVEVWGEKRLAYPIKRGKKNHSSGYYVQMYFDATADQVSELQRIFNTDDAILKHIVVRHDPDFEYKDDPITPEESEQSSEESTNQEVDLFYLIFGMEE